MSSWLFSLAAQKCCRARQHIAKPEKMAFQQHLSGVVLVRGFTWQTDFHYDDPLRTTCVSSSNTQKLSTILSISDNLFFPPTRNAIHKERLDQWKWQCFPDCQDSRNVNARLGAPSFGKLDGICAHPGYACEVLMTVLRGPSQHQICVFISLRNTVSLWMLAVWCRLSYVAKPAPIPLDTHRLYTSPGCLWVYMCTPCTCARSMWVACAPLEGCARVGVPAWAYKRRLISVCGVS